MYTKHLNIKGTLFIQQMDLSTDEAIYLDCNANLLMTVDSSGNCLDAKQEPFGKFSLNYGGDHTWRYESEDHKVIQTGKISLFDEAEPFVVGELFGKQRTSHCKHCGKFITHAGGRLWKDHLTSEPQYCWINPMHGSRLHEPTPQGA